MKFLYFCYKLLAFKYFPKIMHPQKIFFKGKFINYGSRLWFAHNYKEIFLDKNYLFHTENNHPFIIDCGANIGLSVIFFKFLYPNSDIIAFEPDENMYQQCVNNIKTFNFNNVKIFKEAVWTADTELEFVSTKNLGGQIKFNIEIKGNILNVKAVRLLNKIDRKIDFLKIDIEGAETELIKDISEKLYLVENIFIEYHSYANQVQDLSIILEILKNAGFKYYIKEAYPNKILPFIEKNKKSTFDLQLNIFGYRI